MAQATKAKPRLGRGLSSLISVSSLPVEAEIVLETPVGQMPHPAPAAARFDGQPLC